MSGVIRKSDSKPWFSQCDERVQELEGTKNEIAKRCFENETVPDFKKKYPKSLIIRMFNEERIRDKELSRFHSQEMQHTVLSWTLKSPTENKTEEMTTNYSFYGSADEVFQKKIYQLQFPNLNLEEKKVSLYFENKSDEIIAIQKIKNDSIFFKVPFSKEKFNQKNRFFNLMLSIGNNEVYMAKQKFKMTRYFNARRHSPTNISDVSKKRKQVETSLSPEIKISTQNLGEDDAFIQNFSDDGNKRLKQEKISLSPKIKISTQNLGEDDAFIQNFSDDDIKRLNEEEAPLSSQKEEVSTQNLGEDDDFVKSFFNVDFVL